MTRAKALTIAGSDSGGGAGIQADLKTFLALDVYGTSVLTAVTAQNTLGVQAVVELPPEFVAQQFDSVLADIGTHAAKTGMLSSIPLVRVVSHKIQEHKLRQLVVDPVMVAKGGHPLLREEARRVLAEVLLPLALVVTPNLHEAGLLAEMEVNDRSSMEEAARRIKALGPLYVVVKGGHLAQAACDLLFDGHSVRTYVSTKLETVCTHGAGCTFSAAITAALAKGQEVAEAVATAKAFVTKAMAAGFLIGQGHAPLNHRAGFVR
ncbi:MAG TPA: bifunctional hydroxymethylpyrimidine kinase/phosphomethylpyrimidine kinase [Candidatus Binatia bacterium]|jgi:hydroxymethylpyrimidine/phosphomethylpyrimidine kinase|nr:bifunctional hydroxymethylpyrimidine kinase/phosphomethylpyrimidine kinase [Candidatus Binatia bacterium]